MLAEDGFERRRIGRVSDFLKVLSGAKSLAFAGDVNGPDARTGGALVEALLHFQCHRPVERVVHFGPVEPDDADAILDVEKDVVHEIELGRR